MVDQWNRQTSSWKHQFCVCMNLLTHEKLLFCIREPQSENRPKLSGNICHFSNQLNRKKYNSDIIQNLFGHRKLLSQVDFEIFESHHYFCTLFNIHSRCPQNNMLSKLIWRIKFDRLIYSLRLAEVGCFGWVCDHL